MFIIVKDMAAMRRQCVYIFCNNQLPRALIAYVLKILSMLRHLLQARCINSINWCSFSSVLGKNNSYLSNP